MPDLIHNFASSNSLRSHVPLGYIFVCTVEDVRSGYVRVRHTKHRSGESIEPPIRADAATTKIDHLRLPNLQSMGEDIYTSDVLDRFYLLLWGWSRVLFHYDEPHCGRVPTVGTEVQLASLFLVLSDCSCRRRHHFIDVLPFAKVPRPNEETVNDGISSKRNLVSNFVLLAGRFVC